MIIPSVLNGDSPLSLPLNSPLLLALGGVVLEEFLDEVDVSEDHTAAAVAAEVQGVDGIARRSVSFGSYVEARVDVQGGRRVGSAHTETVQRGGLNSITRQQNSPVRHALVDHLEVTLPEVADDLQMCQ